MTKAEQEAKELFDALSKEELISLLTESGFEVVEGQGRVIFSDSVSATIKSTYQTKVPETKSESGINSFPVAC